jgi:NosR/NirI family transcriptional regulator, nitrous oxide reductase regulator
MRILNKITILFFTLAINLAFGQVQRFPKPDFQAGYEQPSLTTPEPRAMGLEMLDVIVLIGALSLASYFALKKRSRKHIFGLTLFSLAYFGFWRQGCVCSIGAIQNVSLAMFDSGYVIPLIVVAFFALPLIFTLFFGRTFCAGVCPLGAIQDVVLLKPVRVPNWLAQGLSILPYVYLGTAVLFAATGAGFLICRYDPFIGFFRFGASFNMILFGGFLLLLATVVGRPYCRFLCPLSVLLNWSSRLSRKHVTITPAECINCRLCEDSCPFGAINPPSESGPPEKRSQGLKRLALVLVLAPIIIIASGWVISKGYVPLSRQHFTVSLAEQIRMENQGLITESTEETKAFRSSGTPVQELYDSALAIQNKFRIGGWILGGFIGFIIIVKIINLSIIRQQNDYTADNGNCVSCGRCFSYCPVQAGTSNQ